jgi:hypothetical protein
MSVVPLSGLLGRAPIGLLVDPAPELSSSLAGNGAEALDLCGARFVTFAERATLVKDAERLGFLPVTVPPPRASDRGKLALVLEEAIESALDRRGACPPGVGATADLDGSLGDQLYRARLIEQKGLCVCVESLEAIATLAGALDAEDSAILRWWVDAARTRPIALALSDENRMLGVYGPPLPLEGFVVTPLPTRGAPAALEAVPSVDAGLSESSGAMQLSVERRSAPRGPSLLGDLTLDIVESLSEPNDTPAETAVEAASDVARDEGPLVPQTSALTEDPSSDAERGPDTDRQPAPEVSALAAPADDMPPTPVAPVVEAREEAPAVSIVESVPKSGEVLVAHPPLEPSASSDWPRWVGELTAAHGPKPLAAVERMFVKSYVPLHDAMCRGIAPRAEVEPVLETWARSFDHSYRAAFDALRLRGKRPTMVLDVPDVAHRIGRLHGARAVQLLLVDGLRFDLGLRVEDSIRNELRHEVALTERLLLWSALPSDTRSQLELIGRGPQGLADFAGPPADSEVPVARGRMARLARRIKAGHRELLKLDLVEASLSEPGAAEAERLDSLAREVTGCIIDVVATMPPRTLLFVFGDHGFLLDEQGTGTGAARHGGARPEEVLVPAFAWLVGGVQ